MISPDASETVKQMSSNMKFGSFMAPVHPPGGSVTHDYGRDLETIEWMDDLATTRSPSVSTTVAATRSSPRRRSSSPLPRSGPSGSTCTGVASLAYRHPLLIADTLAQLDHLTKGRVFLGVGPGALPGDARMMGIDFSQNRRRMEESMDAIMHLFLSDEPLNMETDWFKFVDGYLPSSPTSDRTRRSRWPRWPRPVVHASPASTASRCCR